MKIRPVGAELFHVDGREDERTGGKKKHDEINIRFRNFAKVPKMTDHSQLHL